MVDGGAVEEPRADGGTSSPDAGHVTSCLEALPLDWPEPESPYDRSEELGVEDGQEGATRFSCVRTKHDVLRDHDSILGLGDAYADLRPGIVLQGEAFRRGVINPMPLRRAPATLAIDLGIDNPVRRVEAPSSASLQQAVSELQRRADAALGNLPVLPARFSYTNEVVSSYEEAVLALGASFSFSGGLGSAGFDSEFSTSRSRLATTVVVKLFQPMYTISFADDEIARDVDFFAADLSASDLDAQCMAGSIGPNNPPVFVKSVTYGRIVVFSFTTTEVINAQELKLLIQGSFLGFRGEADAQSRYQSIASQASIKVLAMGGSQDDAMEAIRTGDYNLFFTPAPATTAVPLSYRVNYLRGTRPTARIASTLSYVSESCSFEDCVDVTTANDWDLVVHQGNGGNHAPLNTGIDIQPNDGLTLTANGSIWAGVAFTGCNGPSGWDSYADGNFPLPGAHVFSLIGRVGSSGWQEIGNGRSFPNTSWMGTLELATNDNDPISGDDCGTGFHVRVSRTRTTCEWQAR
ncbi:MAG: thiol-activated cytolysin family protein [Deltaproteobacteria bacterium]|nr:thiol-activated cytolysin family protein [Deltaproteobacteria bacterium]